VRAVNINRERNIAVELVVPNRLRGVAANLNSGGGRSIVQQTDELVSVLVIRDNFLLDFHLLLQNGHLPVQVRQLGLKLPQLFVFTRLFLDLGPDLVIGLDLGIQIHVVIGHAYNQGHQQHDSQPGPKRHFIEFRHVKRPYRLLRYDSFTLLDNPISQMSSNLKACNSFTEESCEVSLISTVLNAPVLRKFVIRSATASALSAIPTKFKLLPSEVMESSHTASVLLTVSATRFSRLTGPF